MKTFGQIFVSQRKSIGGCRHNQNVYLTGYKADFYTLFGKNSRILFALMVGKIVILLALV